MKVMGMDVAQKQKQTFYFKWTPLEQKDKDWIVEQEIIGVKMEIQIGGNTINYDSTNPATANNPLADFFKALVGSKFKLTIGPDMKVSKVEGRKEFLDKLVNANQQMKPLLESILSEDALKQMADPSFAAIPNKEVKKDETWEYKSKLGPRSDRRLRHRLHLQVPGQGREAEGAGQDRRHRTLKYEEAGRQRCRWRPAVPHQGRQAGEQERHRHRALRPQGGPRR